MEDVFLIGTFIALKQILDFSSSSEILHSYLKKKSLKFIKIYWAYVACNFYYLFIIALV